MVGLRLVEGLRHRKLGLGQDMGGSVGDTMQTLTVHGSSATDQRMTMDGLPAPNSEGSEG